MNSPETPALTRNVNSHASESRSSSPCVARGVYTGGLSPDNRSGVSGTSSAVGDGRQEWQDDATLVGRQSCA